MERDLTGKQRTNALSNTPGALLVLLRLLPALGIVLLLGVTAPAEAQTTVEQTTEGVAAQIQRASRAAERAAQRAERAAQRAAANLAAKQQRTAERLARRDARQRSREAIRLASKEKNHNVVTIDCAKITVAYNMFPSVAASPNHVIEWITIKNPPESISREPIVFPPILYSFAGSSGTEVVQIPFPVGHYLVDVHAKWDTNGYKGNFDIHGNVTCGPAPAFTISKLQSIGAGGQPPTSEPLSGKVGQIVDYAVTVTNTGNTPLTFTNFVDPHCDPGTIRGGSLAPIEPLETLTYTCTHTLTGADAAAGLYTNVASVSASPELYEGFPITHESNTVLVTPVSEAKQEEKTEEEPEAKPEEKHEEQPEARPVPKGEVTTPKSEVLGTTTTLAPTPPAQSGVLGFSSATVPALKGPHGCARHAFLASIRAKGVSTVIFYLDGHRIARLTYRNARHGLLSVRIRPGKLRVGVHHLRAQITMKRSSPSAKAARAARQLTVIRCKSSVITPRFTG